MGLDTGQVVETPREVAERHAAAAGALCPRCGHMVDEHDRDDSGQRFCGLSLDDGPTGCHICRARFDKLRSIPIATYPQGSG